MDFYLLSNQRFSFLVGQSVSQLPITQIVTQFLSHSVNHTVGLSVILPPINHSVFSQLRNALEYVGKKMAPYKNKAPFSIPLVSFSFALQKRLHICNYLQYVRPFVHTKRNCPFHNKFRRNMVLGIQVETSRLTLACNNTGLSVLPTEENANSTIATFSS